MAEWTDSIDILIDDNSIDNYTGIYQAWDLGEDQPEAKDNASYFFVSGYGNYYKSDPEYRDGLITAANMLQLDYSEEEGEGEGEDVNYSENEGEDEDDE